MLFREDTVARAEHNAVRENVGWYRWTHDLVEVSGKEAGALLDYLCVNDIAGAAVGQTKYTAILNEEGKLVDDTIVMRMGEETYWVSTVYAPRFQPWLLKHKGEKEVEMKELTWDIDMYAVQGPNSPAFMNAILTNPVDDLKRFRVADNKIGDVDVKIHRSGFTGENGYEIYCSMADSPKIAEAIRAKESQFNAKELRTLEVYVRSLPMEKGFALRQDMYGLTPYECGLGWSVKLEKDFVGKEALVKAKEEGPQYKLVGLELDPERESYEDIAQNEVACYKGVQVGIVRQMIYGYTVDKNIGFAIVDIKHAVPGTVLELGSNRAKATVCDKTFIK